VRSQRTNPGQQGPDPDVGRLRKVFLASIGLCILIVFHLFFRMRSEAGNALAQTSLLCMLLWAFVVTYYVFHSLVLLEQRARAACREMMHRDGITGVLTMEYLKSTLEQQQLLVLEGDHEVTIAYLRIVGLDKVNDEFGHATGNIVMQALGKMMADALPESVLLARLGGAEFVAFMPGMATQTARDKLAGVCEAIRKYTLDLGFRGSIAALNAEAGLTAYTEGTKSLEDLIRAAQENPLT